MTDAKRRLLCTLAVPLVVGYLGGCGGGGSGGGGQPRDRTAITLTSLGAAGFNYTQGTYLLGFVFRPKAALRITEVGFYDAALTGRTQTFEAHAVGVYDLSTHALLGSATVGSASPVGGLFRWTALAAPVTLSASGTYAIVGITGTNAYTVGIQTSEATVEAGIELVSGAGYSATATNNDPTQTSTLQEPNAFDAGNIFGTVPEPTVLPDFGPNFRFTVP